MLQTFMYKRVHELSSWISLSRSFGSDASLTGKTECGRNLNYRFIPRPMDKSVIISCQFYMNLLTNDIYS